MFRTQRSCRAEDTEKDSLRTRMLDGYLLINRFFEYIEIGASKSRAGPTHLTLSSPLECVVSKHALHDRKGSLQSPAMAVSLTIPIYR
jgi:hypothetical protein